MLNGKHSAVPEAVRLTERDVVRSFLLSLLHLMKDALKVKETDVKITAEKLDYKI